MVTDRYGREVIIGDLIVFQNGGYLEIGKVLETKVKRGSNKVYRLLVKVIDPFYLGEDVKVKDSRSTVKLDGRIKAQN